MKQILRMFVRITCKKLKSRNWYFILSRFFVPDDQGWQDKRSLALCENVRLPVEAGRGQVSTYPLSLPLVSDRKLELLGHGFDGRPAGGHLPKPLHELSLIVGNLSAASFNWLTNIFSQDENSPVSPVLLISMLGT